MPTRPRLTRSKTPVATPAQAPTPQPQSTGAGRGPPRKRTGLHFEEPDENHRKGPASGLDRFNHCNPTMRLDAFEKVAAQVIKEMKGKGRPTTRLMVQMLKAVREREENEATQQRMDELLAKIDRWLV